MDARCTSPSEGGFKKRARECCAGSREPVSLVSDRLLAILVDQESDPKVPYQGEAKGDAAPRPLLLPRFRFSESGCRVAKKGRFYHLS